MKENMEKHTKENCEKIESWENPNIPSGQLEEAFILAEKFRAIEHAPAVRLDHFLLAVLIDIHPPIAEGVLKVFENVRDVWRKEL